MTGILLALAASFVFALGTVLQHRAAVSTADEEAGTGLLLRLARRPVWLAGMAADAVGFVFHAAALGAGRLVLVQPLLATSLVFALPLGAALDHRRISRGELRAAVVVSAGLIGFLAVADPSGGHDDAPLGRWLVAFGVGGVVAAAAALGGRGAAPARRAVLLGSAAGVLFGLSAALTKTTVEELDEGILAVLTDWPVYALLVVGYAGTAFAQSSLQTGALGPAVATQTIFDPLASVLLGTLVFGEQCMTARSAPSRLCSPSRRWWEGRLHSRSRVAEVDRQPDDEPDGEPQPGADRQRRHQRQRADHPGRCDRLDVRQAHRALGDRHHRRQLVSRARSAGRRTPASANGSPPPGRRTARRRRRC
jgi:drug/metabolite transporter (DMT)-like permease